LIRTRPCLQSIRRFGMKQMTDFDPFCFREVLQHSPSPVHLAWERVPDRAGEGILMKCLMLELVKTEGPHPAFGHLLPSRFAGREKAKRIDGAYTHDL
jgi:hypothetical protein